MQLFQVIFVIVIFVKVNSFNILSVFLYDGESHFRAVAPLLKELTRRGHKVTVLGYFPLTEKLNGYTDIVWDTPNVTIKLPIFHKLNSRIAKHVGSHLIRSGTEERCQMILNTSKFRDVVKNINKYDLIITEYFDTNCFIYPIIATTNVPLIGFQSHALLPWTNSWVANPNNPSYIPSVFFNFSNKMSFWERLENTFAWIYGNIFYSFKMKSEDYNFFQKYFEKNLSVNQDVVFNTSITFTNSHFSIHGARPFVPNVVEVGGIHLKEPKQLPENIENWINQSTSGVIYVCFGSMIKANSFSEEKRRMFIRTFTRFPQRILWKWETDAMPEKSDNIMIEKWMPQFDILCHPNVKAFIGHGGLLGVIEAVHCGVPLILLPQFGDQFLNAKAIEVNGGGLSLDFHSFDEESLYNALKTVLNPSFNRKTKELSARFKDRLIPPLETAVYWIEYVVRHGGAAHLRSAAVGIPLYQYLLLDVILFCIGILFLFVGITYVIFRKLFSKKTKYGEKLKNN